MQNNQEINREIKIIEYLRDKHRSKIGVMVAFISKDNLSAGISKCINNQYVKDEFNREVGLAIAEGRAKVHGIWGRTNRRGKNGHIPYRFQEVYNRFLTKAHKIQDKLNGVYNIQT